MKKFFPIIIVSALFLTGCANEFNQVYKTSDYTYKYEYAKECFMKGKYTRTVTLLQDLVTLQKGTDNAQESLYMLAMAQYLGKDYESAATTFKLPEGRLCRDGTVLCRPKPVYVNTRTQARPEPDGCCHFCVSGLS